MPRGRGRGGPHRCGVRKWWVWLGLGQLSWCVLSSQVMPVGMVQILHCSSSAGASAALPMPVDFSCSLTAHTQLRADFNVGTAGTARCREAVSKLSEHYNVVVNIQVRVCCCCMQSGCIWQHPAPPRPSLRPFTGCCREMSPSSVSAAKHACPSRRSGKQRAPALLID